MSSVALVVTIDDTQIKRPDDVWPEAETVVHAPPPPPPAEPPPARNIGTGMLIALVVVLLVAAGFGVAWYLLHRDTTSASNTVTVTTAATTKHRAAAPAAGSKQQTTTAPPTTTAPAPPPEPASSTVPDVTQQPEAAAAQALSQAGILASLAFVPAKDPLGTVMAQAKPAGTSLPFHSHLQINLSTGPGQKQSETVPNVIGQPLQQALAAINGAHLRLIYLRFPVTSPSQAGKIVQQSPLGGGTAPQNAQVLVYLGALKQQ